MKKAFTTYLCGMCVGAADIVPGISGGTIAFIIGIYEKLLESISTLTTKNLPFLVPFLLGVATSFLSLATFINYLLHHESYRVFLYAGFMGLVVGSAIFCAKLLERITLKVCLFFVLGAVSAFFLSGTKLEYQEPQYSVPIHVAGDFSKCRNVKDDQITGVKQSLLASMVAKKYLAMSDTIYDPAPRTVSTVLETRAVPLIDPWLVLCGAIAISAMLLPGISGSYLLQILGMFGLVLACLVDWIEGLKALSFDWYAFRVLMSMGIGIVLGAACFGRVVRYLLHRFRANCIGCLVGFMLGALGSVWPFWSYAYELSPVNQRNGGELVVVQPIMPTVFSVEFFIATLFFLSGLCIVFMIERASQRQYDKCSIDSA